MTTQPFTNHHPQLATAVLSAQAAFAARNMATGQAGDQFQARQTAAETMRAAAHQWADEQLAVVAGLLAAGRARAGEVIDTLTVPAMTGTSALTADDAKLALQTSVRNAQTAVAGVQDELRALTIWQTRRTAITTSAIIVAMVLLGLIASFALGPFVRERIAEAAATLEPGADQAVTATTPTSQTVVTDVPSTLMPSRIPATRVVAITTVENGPEPAPIQTDQSAPPPIATAGDEIVFQSNRGGDYEVYIMNIDGSDQRQLTDNTFEDRYPRVSPDGRQIVFQSRRNNNSDIFVINRDGSGERQLTFDSTLDELPSWSPDGTAIVFNSWLGNNSELFVVGVDGANLRRLTDSSLDEAHASWSSTGRLAFNGTAAGESNFQLYTAQPDLSDLQKITDSHIDEHSPEWSPDGSQLLFISERGNSTNPGVYVMDADGGNARMLYNGRSEEWGATWSGDGAQVVFTADQANGTASIYIMDADGDNPRLVTERGGYPSWAAGTPVVRNETAGSGGSNNPVRLTGNGLTQLTFSPNADYTPALSPDQRQLVFASEVDGRWQLLQANVNGGGELTPLVAGPFNIYAPDFSPDGRTLLATSNADGDLDIVLIDAGTGEILEQLTNMPGDEQLPRWLPDGASFIFSAKDETDKWAIYAGDMEGNLTQLARSGHFDGIAFPSPDGQQVTFYSGRDGDYEIYLMDVDGENQTRLTMSEGRDAAPVFSPDGEWIAFESDRDGDYELFVMRPDGSDVRQLTFNTDGDWVPIFSPDGEWLLFQSDRSGNMDIYRMPFEP